MTVQLRKSREKQALKENILNAAMELFLISGYENVSIRNIAEKIEYSPATVYNYFKDKDEILFTLHHIAFDAFFEVLNKTTNIKSPGKRLHELGKAYIDFALNNREYYDLMFIMRAPMKKVNTPEDWEVGLRSYKLLHETVKECVDTGLIKDKQTDILTYGFWSHVHGLVSLVLRKRTVMIPDEYTRNVLNIALEINLKQFLGDKIYE